MSNIIAKLKDPELVWQFQYYFGIRRRENETPSNAFHNGGSHGEKTTPPTQTPSHTTASNVPNGFNHRNKAVNQRNGILLDNKVNNSSTKTLISGQSSIATATTTTDDDSESNSSSSVSSDGKNHHNSNKHYLITISFWYHLFNFGAALGDEAFYVSFFPFWFWNIDGAVCRRVATIWVIIMYIGQGLKDIIRWPRPKCPPVIRLEEKWALEYGMPSTHAMVATAVPFSFLYYTMYRYEYPVILGVIVCSFWCLLVCGSRLYLGMHTVLDVIVGVLLVGILMFVVVPFIDAIDNFTLTQPYSPVYIVGIYILMIIFYPDAGHWTPARGDSVIILGAGAGIALGSWLNFQWGIIRGPPMPPPYQILWPTYEMAGLTLLRTCIGIAIVVATRAFFKSLIYAVVCYLWKLDPNDKANHRKLIVESSSKFITYTAIAFNVTYLSPAVFRLLNIERVTMFTEI